MSSQNETSDLPARLGDLLGELFKQTPTNIKGISSQNETSDLPTRLGELFKRTPTNIKGIFWNTGVEL